MAPFKFVDRISRGQPIDMYGDGSSMRDYTYIDDVVAGILSALFTPFRKNPTVDGPSSPAAAVELHRVYNLGNGSPITLSAFIAQVEECVGRRALINRLPDQTGDVDRTFADTALAQKELAYRPRTDLKRGLTELVRWYRDSYDIIIGK